MLRSCTSSQARETLYRLMDDISDSHQPFLITGRRNNVVMISEEDFRAMEETLYLLSVPGLRESLLKASKESLDDCLDSKDVQWE